MKAAHFTDFQGALTVETLPDPAPTPTGVVVRVEASGVCRSDWHGWMGHDPDITLPHVPGHEWAGVIEAVGAQVTAWKPGDRVTAPFVCGCGDCPECREGNQQVCPHQFQAGFTAWGSFAELVMIEYADENLVRLPESMDFVTAASLGCRMATSFRAVVHQARLQPGEWIAVHGCGGVGLSAIIIARALGARPLAIDVDPAKLQSAADLGAVATIDAARSDDVPAEVEALTTGGAHVSLDAHGSTATAANSIRCLRPRGRHVQVGLMTGEAAHSPVPFDRIIARELQLSGSHGMQAHAYPDLFAMIDDGRLDPARLVGRTTTLADALPALTTESAFAHPGITVINHF
ncbi:MAG: zinc-dependent alcohol dehydrogenase family protein [Akkermansiaceae bacterium]|nr:zinc-dependent alcohol dehydrogenase family protein [Akkermansiaceae bacterium]